MFRTKISILEDREACRANANISATPADRPNTLNDENHIVLSETKNVPDLRSPSRIFVAENFATVHEWVEIPLTERLPHRIADLYTLIQDNNLASVEIEIAATWKLADGWSISGYPWRVRSARSSTHRMPMKLTGFWLWSWRDGAKSTPSWQRGLKKICLKDLRCLAYRRSTGYARPMAWNDSTKRSSAERGSQHCFPIQRVACDW